MAEFKLFAKMWRNFALTLKGRSARHEITKGILVMSNARTKGLTLGRFHLLKGAAVVVALAIVQVQASAEEKKEKGLLNKLAGAVSPKSGERKRNGGTYEMPPTSPGPNVEEDDSKNGDIDKDQSNTRDELQKNLKNKIIWWREWVDEATEEVDKWGYASATGLILIEDTNEGRVGFNNDRTFEQNYLEAGKLQGAAANVIQKSLQTSIEAGYGSDELLKSKDRNTLLREDIEREQLAQQATDARRLSALKQELEEDRLERQIEQEELLHKRQVAADQVQFDIQKQEVVDAAVKLQAQKATLQQEQAKLLVREERLLELQGKSDSGEQLSSTETTELNQLNGGAEVAGSVASQQANVAEVTQKVNDLQANYNLKFGQFRVGTGAGSKLPDVMPSLTATGSVTTVLTRAEYIAIAESHGFTDDTKFTDAEKASLARLGVNITDVGNLKAYKGKQIHERGGFGDVNLSVDFVKAAENPIKDYFDPSPVKRTFSEPGSLIPEGTEIGLSVDDKQIMAASTTVSGKLLELMAHPKGLPENTRAFLGITQISVSPGYHTGENYFCEVSVSVSYGSRQEDAFSIPDPDNPGLGKNLTIDDLYERLRFEGRFDLSASAMNFIYHDLLSQGDRDYLQHLKQRDNLDDDEVAIRAVELAKFQQRIDRVRIAQDYDYKAPPLIYSAFPLAKSQVLDQRHSFRSQVELMWLVQLQLIQAGQKAAAKNVGKFIKQVEQDVATVSALPVVVPSSNGRFISYRFDPTLHALSNPASAKSKAGNRLKATSIPALVVIVCHEDDLDKFNTLRLYSATRWIPRVHKVPGINLIGQLTDWERDLRRNQEEEKIQAIARLDGVERAMDSILREAEERLNAEERFEFLKGNDGLLATLRSRVNDLTQKVGTSYLDVPIPDQTRSHLTVSPSEVNTTKNKSIVFAVKGDGIHPSPDMKGYLGGLPLEPLNENQPDEDVLLFRWSVNSPELEGFGSLAQGAHDFVVVSNGQTRLAPAAVTFTDGINRSLQERLDDYRMVRDAEQGGGAAGRASGPRIYFEPFDDIILSGQNHDKKVTIYRVGNNGSVEARLILRDRDTGEIITEKNTEIGIYDEAVGGEGSPAGIGNLRTDWTLRWANGSQDPIRIFIKREAANLRDSGRDTRYTLSLDVEEDAVVYVESGRGTRYITLPNSKIKTD